MPINIQQNGRPMQTSHGFRARQLEHTTMKSKIVQGLQTAVLPPTATLTVARLNTPPTQKTDAPMLLHIAAKDNIVLHVRMLPHRQKTPPRGVTLHDQKPHPHIRATLQSLGLPSPQRNNGHSPYHPKVCSFSTRKCFHSFHLFSPFFFLSWIHPQIHLLHPALRS